MESLLRPRAGLFSSTESSPGCRVRSRLLLAASLLLPLTAPATALADARFDLIGPRVEVRVTRGIATLPIASVPNLQPGDRIWLHPDLPTSQSVHYLMVLIFLRGTTNPPPDNWFTRIETWDKKVREEGVTVTVPEEAQQAVIFLAPVTGGDFSTLRSAVQGRPGIFVRASQDLNEAGFEQARIEKYIASMKEVPSAQASDPKALLEHSNTIARTLSLRPSDACMKLPPDQQYTCLTQTGNQTLLDDGHGQTIVTALSTGPGSDFINAASATALAGGGIYSAYVGAIVDLVRIMGTLHTAQYQYIPAIAFPQQESMNLRLNTPPSFHNPKSVIVIGLPAVQKSIPPPLRVADPKLVACLAKPAIVLQVEGAPLVFSTSLAHDLVLHVNYPVGSKEAATGPQDIPLTSEAYQGGLILAKPEERKALPFEDVAMPKPPAGSPVPAAKPAPTTPPGDPNLLTGTIHGSWGFDAFTGPTMPLQYAPGKDWHLAMSEALISGRENHLLVASTGTACIQSIDVEQPDAKHLRTEWKQADRPNTIDVSLSLRADPGNLHISIEQYGTPQPSTVGALAYSEPAKLEHLQFHAGDTEATLSGTSLEEVQGVEFDGMTLKPAPIQPESVAGQNLRTSLRLVLPPATPPGSKALVPGTKTTAHVELNDGRHLDLGFTVLPPRPSVTLLSKVSLSPDAAATSAPTLHLADPNDLPISQPLTFSLHSAQPFSRTGQVEIANADESLSAVLSIASGSLILQDPNTVLATVDPLKMFGTSAFGPVRLRPVAVDGTRGEWLDLGNFVRLPTLTALVCPTTPAPASLQPTPAPASASPATQASPIAPADPAAPPIASSTPQACTLTGSALYLIAAVASDATFANATAVPAGFVGVSLNVPAPAGGVFYLRLRDDPAPSNPVTLPQAVPHDSSRHGNARPKPGVHS